MGSVSEHPVLELRARRLPSICCMSASFLGARIAALREYGVSLVCRVQVSESEIRIAQRAEREQEKIKKTMKARMDFLDFID